ncbi:MAG: hypothetical protein HY290_04725 [Planctomycetia bacterium]|nr:hypothetical protein [Planctomycetia bacterium]
MLQLINFVINLFVLLPWWGAVAVLLGLAASFWAFGHYIVYRLKRDIVGSIKEQGQPLHEALVTVHSVEQAEPPAEKSSLDEFDSEFDDEFADENDEDDAELDGEFAAEDTAWNWIDVTIAPKAADASWNPSDLALVPADFQAQEELEFCEQTGLLHTLEIWRNGKFQPQRNGNVAGTQRLRMLFAVAPEVRNAKFTYHFTEFGRLNLPAPRKLAHAR